MKENEVKELRARRVEIVKPKAPTISSDEISLQIKAFEEKGGIITRIPFGLSVDTDVAMPLALQIDYTRGRNRKRFNGQVKK